MDSVSPEILTIANYSLSKVKNRRFARLQDYAFPDFSVIEDQPESDVLENKVFQAGNYNDSKEFVFSMITRNDCVITGDPGDGKSTLLAKITEASCYVKLTPEHVSEVFQTRNLAESCELVPVMIRLTDLVQKGRQGITIQDSDDEKFLAKLQTFYSHIEGNEIISKTIRNGIKNNSKLNRIFLILLDGFDELDSIGSQRKNFVEHFEEILRLRDRLEINNVKFIISSRNLVNLQTTFCEFYNQASVEKTPFFLNLEWDTQKKHSMIENLGMANVLSPELVRNPLDLWSRYDLYKSGSESFRDKTVGHLILDQTIRAHLLDRSTDEDYTIINNDKIWKELKLVIALSAFLSMMNGWKIDSATMDRLSEFVELKKSSIDQESATAYGKVVPNLFSSLPLLHPVEKKHGSSIVQIELRWRHKQEAENLCLSLIDSYVDDKSLSRFWLSERKTNAYDYALNIGLHKKTGEPIAKSDVETWLRYELLTMGIDGGFFVDTKGLWKGDIEPSIQFHAYLDDGYYSAFQMIGQKAAMHFEQEEVLVEQSDVKLTFVNSLDKSDDLFFEGLLCILVNEESLLNEIIRIAKKETARSNKTIELFFSLIEYYPLVLADDRYLDTLCAMYSLEPLANDWASSNFKSLSSHLRRSIRSDLIHNPKGKTRTIFCFNNLVHSTAQSLRTHLFCMILKHIAKRNYDTLFLNLFNKIMIHEAAGKEFNKALCEDLIPSLDRFHPKSKCEKQLNNLLKQSSQDFNVGITLVELFLNQRSTHGNLSKYVDWADNELVESDSELGKIIFTAWTKIPSLHQLELLFRYHESSWAREIVDSIGGTGRVICGPSSITFGESKEGMSRTLENKHPAIYTLAYFSIFEGPMYEKGLTLHHSLMGAKPIQKLLMAKTNEMRRYCREFAEVARNEMLKKEFYSSEFDLIYNSNQITVNQGIRQQTYREYMLNGEGVDAWMAALHFIFDESLSKGWGQGMFERSRSSWRGTGIPLSRIEDDGIPVLKCSYCEKEKGELTKESGYGGFTCWDCDISNILSILHSPNDIDTPYKLKAIKTLATGNHSKHSSIIINNIEPILRHEGDEFGWHMRQALTECYKVYASESMYNTMVSEIIQRIQSSSTEPDKTVIRFFGTPTLSSEHVERKLAKHLHQSNSDEIINLAVTRLENCWLDASKIHWNSLLSDLHYAIFFLVNDIDKKRLSEENILFVNRCVKKFNLDQFDERSCAMYRNFLSISKYD